MDREEFKAFAENEFAKAKVTYEDLDDGSLKVKYTLIAGCGRRSGIAATFSPEAMRYHSEVSTQKLIGQMQRAVFDYAVKSSFWEPREIEIQCVISTKEETMNPAGEKSE